jgi:predicted  nucleic acid-binding Zn-ribbon protein
MPMPVLDLRSLELLQELDLQLDALRQEDQRIRSILGSREHLKTARARLQELTKVADKHAASLRDLELELASVNERITQKTKLLYGGTVVNPRELNDLQADIRQHDEQRKRLEDRVLEAMVAAEDAQRQREEQAAALAKLESEFAVNSQQLQERQKTVEREIAQLEQQRQAILPEVPRALLGTYEALRRRLGGRVLAEVAQGRCGHCHITVSDVQVRRLQRREEIVYCESCGRMQYMRT